MENVSTTLDQALCEIRNHHNFDDLVQESQQMKNVINQAKLLAQKENTILVTGEKGVGKKVVARCIHHDSPRKDESFLPVDCGAIPPQLYEVELFGCEQGEFQGITGNYKGRMLQAQNGTIYLDEISACPLPIQSALLIILDEKKFLRQSTKKISIDVRLIASSNKKLGDEVNLKRFRSDLYYRLMESMITIPPLRERLEDIIPLFHHFLEIYNLIYNKKITKIEKSAEDYLRDYAWWGNVEELKHTVKNLVSSKKEELIVPEDLPCAIIAGSKPVGRSMPSLEEQEKNYIIEVLKSADFNLSLAADILVVQPSILQRKIKYYELEDTLRED